MPAHLIPAVGPQPAPAAAETARSRVLLFDLPGRGRRRGLWRRWRRRCRRRARRQRRIWRRRWRRFPNVRPFLISVRKAATAVLAGELGTAIQFITGGSGSQVRLAEKADGNNGGGGGALGGAIFVHGGTVVVQNSTFFNNSVFRGNGGTAMEIPATTEQTREQRSFVLTVS